jgi:hypothetical protein
MRWDGMGWGGVGWGGVGWGGVGWDETKDDGRGEVGGGRWEVGGGRRNGRQIVGSWIEDRDGGVWRECFWRWGGVGWNGRWNGMEWDGME